jgi:rSAM/selenodomain-associated transferase 2
MISIIIPVLNEAQVLPQTLSHVANQEGTYEIIVVDGGSTDSTVEVIERRSDITLISASQGRAQQMNAGAMRAKGDWLLFLHADTFLPVDAVNTIDQLEPGVEAGCFLHRFTAGHWFLLIVSALHNWRFRRTKIIYGDQAMFIRAELFQKLAGFPDQPILEDVLISEKVLKHTTPIQLEKEVITDARKFLERGVWRSFMEVILIQLHCRFNLPLLARGFFAPVR